jgi:hypothetical protein
VRHFTPDTVNENGSRRVRIMRACNGCGQLIGDVMDDEIQAAVMGLRSSDVRAECDRCDVSFA